MNKEICWIYSTFPGRDEALSAARKLLEHRLIACVNTFENVTSLYHWEGSLVEEKETVFLAKTTLACRAAAMEMLTSLHPYDIPCIVSLPLKEGHAPFFDWVKNQTA